VRESDSETALQNETKGGKRGKGYKKNGTLKKGRIVRRFESTRPNRGEKNRLEQPEDKGFGQPDAGDKMPEWFRKKRVKATRGKARSIENAERGTSCGSKVT